MKKFLVYMMDCTPTEWEAMERKLKALRRQGNTRQQKGVLGMITVFFVGGLLFTACSDNILGYFGPILIVAALGSAINYRERLLLLNILRHYRKSSGH